MAENVLEVGLSMAGLQALVAERVKQEQLKQEHGRSAQTRLVAEPGMKVAALQSRISKFLREKETKDLWFCLAPPASAPQSYGWHSIPNGEWLSKCASLLFELVSVAENTKIVSKKLHRALKDLYDMKELDAMSAGKKTLDDNLDKLDFTIRLLLNMVRKMKCNQVLKARTLRPLCRKDQMSLEILLEHVVMPAGVSQEDVEDPDESQVIVTVEPMALVPLTKPEEDKKTDLCPAARNIARPSKEKDVGRSRASKEAGSPEVAAIFQAILCEKAEGPKLSPKKLQVLPSSLTLQKERGENYENYVPKALEKKPHMKTKKDSEEQALAPEPEAVKAKGIKKRPSKAVALEPANPEAGNLALEEPTVYSAGKYREIMQNYIQEAMNRGETTSRARQLWATSLTRANLLKGLSLPELKRRRFVDKDATENPFVAMVMQADVD